MGCSVKKFLILPFLFVAGLFILGGCKSSKTGFGLPEERMGFFSQARSEERSRKWGEKRAQWQRREDKEAKLMFERMRGHR